MVLYFIADTIILAKDMPLNILPPIKTTFQTTQFLLLYYPCRYETLLKNICFYLFTLTHLLGLFTACNYYLN